MAKTFSFYVYFTDNYSPFTSELKEIELIITKNDLPRLSILVYKMLKRFARHEKRKFEALEKKAVIEALRKEQKNNPKKQIEYQELLDFIEELPLEKIVTPIKRVTEHLDQTFLSPDPAIFGAIKSSLMLALTQNRETNHVEIKAKTGWFKIIAVVALVSLLCTTLYFAYEAGAFDSIWDMMSPSFGGKSDDQIMQQYGNCPALRAAVDSGKLNYDSLSKAVQDVYNSCLAPGGG